MIKSNFSDLPGFLEYFFTLEDECNTGCGINDVKLEIRFNKGGKLWTVDRKNEIIEQMELFEKDLSKIKSPIYMHSSDIMESDCVKDCVSASFYFCSDSHRSWNDDEEDDDFPNRRNHRVENDDEEYDVEYDEDDWVPGEDDN